MTAIEYEPVDAKRPIVRVTTHPTWVYVILCACAIILTLHQIDH